jgi:ribosomal-protein-alanine N-acetyltransferase
MASYPRPERFQVLPMRLSDLADVMRIERASFRVPWSRQVFADELERDWARIDVIKERGAAPVLALINYWLVRDEIHILKIATDPDQRRQGHAARLLEQLMKTAREQAYRLITLEVRRSNLAALSLYRRFGFHSVGIRANYYVEDSEDAVVMSFEPC